MTFGTRCPRITARRSASIAAAVTRPTVRTGRWYSSDLRISSSEYQSFGSAGNGRHGLMMALGDAETPVPVGDGRSWDVVASEI